MASKKSLQELVRNELQDYLFIVVSNREPYLHVRQKGRINWITPASGLTLALDPILRACGGIWVAHGAGDADREVVDKHNQVKVPPNQPAYTLKRVWLTKEQEEGYYYGFANQALWPLFHMVYTRPVFQFDDWQSYKEVNQIFANAVCEAIGTRKAFVFIQDYHFALMPQMIKKKAPQAVVAHFWHIPWPNPEVFHICPWAEKIIDGLLGNDLLGFHIQHHCNNFLDTVDKTVEAKIDHERSQITRRGKKTIVKPFPISVDFEEITQQAQRAETQKDMDHIKKYYGIDREIIGLGVDRVDYTKGIPERLYAVDYFLDRYPKYHKRFLFIQIGVPSRTHIGRYRMLQEAIHDLIDKINWKYGTSNWKPILHINEHQSPRLLRAYYRMAQFCLISALHDGMNMVAKEYISSQVDEKGALILSRFTGAARELEGALIVNPYSTGAMGEAIRTAIEMPAKERRMRMRKMRARVQDYNIYNWAEQIIHSLVGL